MKVYFPSSNHWAKEGLLRLLGLVQCSRDFVSLLVSYLSVVGTSVGASIPPVSEWFGSPCQPLTLDELRSMLQGAIQRTS